MPIVIRLFLVFLFVGVCSPALGQDPASTPELVFSPATVSVSSEGVTGTYTVALGAEPSEDVTVWIRSKDAGAVTVLPLYLTFTAEDWDTTQTATVTGVKDPDRANETVTLTHRASGGGYDEISGTVTVSVTDTEGFALSCGTTVSEGYSLTCTLTNTGSSTTPWPGVAIFHLSEDDNRALVRGGAVDVEFRDPVLPPAEVEGGVWWVGEVLVAYERFDWDGEAASNASRSIFINALNDNAFEGNEQFYITLVPDSSRNTTALYYDTHKQTITVTDTDSASTNTSLESLDIRVAGADTALSATVSGSQYTASVRYEVTEVVVAPTATHYGATIVIGTDEEAVASGGTSRIFKLSAGATTSIPVTVTAEDGDSTQPYTIVVTRSSLPQTVSVETASFRLQCPSTGMEGTTISCILTNTGSGSQAFPVVALIHSSLDSDHATVAEDSIMPASHPSYQDDVGFTETVQTSSEYTYGYGELFSGGSKEYLTYGYEKFRKTEDVAAGATRMISIVAHSDDGEEGAERFYVGLAPADYTGLKKLVANKAPILLLTLRPTAPTVTLELSPDSISENGETSTVTASLIRASGSRTTVTVSATPVSPAVAGDFTLSTNETLTIEAGQTNSTGTVTITANNNGVDAPNKTVMVTGTATNNDGVTGPSDVTLTITDDDATPVITTAALIPVAENETVVATLQATDEDDRTEDLEWEITGGNDRSQFTLMAGGRLAFTAAKDYEEPDDSNGDGDYEVTVQVSDGFNAVEVAFTVRLQDVDDTAPTVSRVAITSDPGTDRTYAVDDEIQVTVTFSETVEVTGTPQLRLELGGGRRTADYEGGSGTAALVFAYKVADGESDTDGMGIEADSLSGGTIRDEARNNAELDHDGLAADSGHKVDGVRPRLAASGGAVVDGTTLTLTYDEALDGGSRPVSGDFTVSGGDRARAVTGVRVNGSAVELTLDVGAEHGEAGIQVSYTPGANPIQDVPGNDAEALSREPVTNDTPDTTSPTVSSLAITSNPGGDQIYAAEDEIEVTVTFSETVVVTRTPRMRLRVGSRNRTAGYLRGSGAAALVFGYEVALGDEDTDGVSIAAGRIDRNGGTIKDEADNDAVLDHEAVAPQAGHKVDGVRPAFLSAAVDGSSLTLTYGEALDGGSRPGTGDFTVEVGGTGRSVSAVSVSGSVVTLTLDPAVEHGDTGIRVNYSPGTRPIRDAVGNDALALSNRSVTNTTGAPPSVTLQLMPTSISENGGSATVTARLSHTSGQTTTVTVSATAVSPAVSGDFSLSSNKTLTIGSGQSASTGTVTITANNNGVDAPNKTVMVTGTATNSEGLTGPSDMTLTITDDDATPVITTAALILVAENETAVATLQATDEDDRTEDLVWNFTGGNDRSQFALMSGGRLAFTAAKDYEDPDDSNGDGDYEVTVQVSDGFNTVEVAFTVRLQDVDDTAPTVSRVAITSNSGTDRTYTAGDEIQVTVTFSETVEVTGTPQLRLELGGGRRTADYEGGSGTAALVFAYTVADGESDTDGMGIEADSLSGTIRDEARNNAELDHDGLAADSGHKVDGVRPRLAASGGAVVDGTTLTLTYDEALDGGSRPVSGDFTVSGGDRVRAVTGVRVNGSAVELTLDVGAEHGEAGIQVSYTPGANPIQDVPGNDAEALSREPVTNDTPDTTSPTVSSLAITSNPGGDQIYAAEDEIEVTVTFSETVVVTRTPRMRLRVGSRNRTAGYLRGSGAAALVFGYEVALGDEDTDGVSIAAGRIDRNGGTIKDEADNDAVLDHEAVAPQAGHKVDGVRPAFLSAAVDGSSLTLTYGEALDGGSRPAPGDFTVEVGGTGRSVSAVSVSGSVVTLTLDPAVEHGDTGIRVNYSPGTRPIRDAVGNDALALSNRSVTNTTGAPPSVTLQLMPTSISENGRSATVTARLSHTSGQTTTVTVSATAVSPAVSGDFSLSMNKTLMIEAAQAASTGTVTITANNNGVDAPNKTVMVMGTATNSEGVTGPSDETLTITDDDATPVITTAALIPVAENETVVATLLATDEDDRTEDLVWDITGGNDQSQFTLTRGGELAFTAAKDYEEPDDSDRDRDYEVTVQVSDGANTVEADFTVRLQDVDDTAPTVSGIRISSNPGTDRTYAAGDEIRVTVTFSETVEVTGAPQLSLELGGGRRTATYEGGSGTAALVFAYEVAGGESDTDGVGVEAGSLSGGTIRDEARNNAELDHDGLAADSGHKVDAVKPQLAATGGVVVDGAALTLTYGELLDGSSTLAASDFTVSGGDLARTVSNAAVSGSAVALTLDPAVEHGETGVTVSYTPGTNPIRDVAGNEAEALSRVPVNNETPDTTAPGVISLAISSNPGSDQAYAAEDVIEVTVSFSETVEVTGTPQVRLRVGSSNRTADYLRGTDTEELGFAYEVADGDEDTDGVSIEAGRIALNGGTIEDEADNPAELAHEAVAAQVGHKVDGVRPVFVSAAVDGSSLTLTYGETLDGGSRPAPGDFTVEVDGAGRSVTGVSVSGSVVTLTLSTAVEHGDTGIRVSYTPGTNPIQDAVGNDARGLSNQAVTNTTGAPNTAPEITTVGPFTVRENQALVRRLAARDDDSGDEVTGWSIMGGADQSQFSITSDTGVLSFQEAPDYESPTDVVSGDPPSGAGDNEYVVTVEVRSGAGARELEAEQTFAVRVTDEREPPDIPEAPAFSGETAGSLTVHWSEPENTGPPIMDYDVRYREGSRGGFTDAQHMGPGLSLTLDDLEPGTAYEVQVRATNDEGTSDWSEPGEGMTVTPLTVEMMGGTEPPVEGPFTVRFSFSEPVRGFTQAAIETAQDPACTDEQNNPVFCEPDIGRLETVDDRVFSTTVTPQTDRVAHNYTLTLTVSGGAVRSSVGNKLNEEAMLGGRVAPPGVTLPISEIGLRASGLDRAGRLNWNRPTNDGGSPIIRYEYRYAPVGEVWNDWENVGAGAVGVTVGNLVNGLEYVFEVRAVNALGKGPVETAAATPVLRTGPPPPPPPPPPGPRKTVPDAPTNLLADGGNEQVALSWEAPENDGGFAITDYEVRINGRGSWISTGSIHTTHTVTGLTNGTAYVFQVRAVNAAGSSPYSNRAEATPGVGALDFAHFANGAGIISDLVFVNVATHPIRPVLYFYGQEGQPIDPESMVDLTEDLEVTEDGALSIRTEMEPLGELTISTHGRGEVMSGSVQVAADGPIGGVLRFDLPGIGVAGVGASQPVRDALFPARRQAGGIATAAAIRNLGEEALVVSCRLMSGGIVLEAVEISLAANGQEARYIEELFTGTDTSDFVGSVRCTAPGLFTGIAVELDDSNRIFTTLPVVPVARTGGRGQEAGLDFAHFANGDGIVSGMVFVNLSTQPSGPGPTPFHAVIRPTRPVLYFYDKGGNLIDPESVVDLTGDLEVTEDGALSIHSEMGPLEELTISTHGRGEVVTGSVTVISEGPIGGVLRFDLPGIGVAGVGASQPVRDALFPARRQAGGISTAAAIHNLEANAQGVACQLMKGGVVLEETEIPLAANGQQARFIEEVFPRTDTSDFVGSVRCTAPEGGRFTGVAVELDAANRIFTTLPVVPVPERVSQE